MRWASKCFSIEPSDPRIPLKKSTFSMGCAERIARSKKLGSKRHFFNCLRMHDLVYDRKSPFSIHRSDCIRIGLSMDCKKKVAHGNHKLWHNCAKMAITWCHSSLFWTCAVPKTWAQKKHQMDRSLLPIRISC